jgi:hypothetical protein
MPDPLKQFVQMVASMDTYEVAKEGEGYTFEQMEGAIETMNALIQMARRITDAAP